MKILEWISDVFESPEVQALALIGVVIVMIVVGALSLAEALL